MKKVTISARRVSFLMVVSAVSGIAVGAGLAFLLMAHIQ